MPRAHAMLEQCLHITGSQPRHIRRGETHTFIAPAPASGCESEPDKRNDTKLTVSAPALHFACRDLSGLAG